MAGSARATYTACRQRTAVAKGLCLRCYECARATRDHARRHAVMIRPLTGHERHQLRTLTGPLLTDLVTGLKNDEGVVQKTPSSRRWASAKPACRASCPGMACRALTTPALRRQAVLQNRRASCRDCDGLAAG